MPASSSSERVAAAQAVLIREVRAVLGCGNAAAIYWLRDHFAGLSSPLHPKTRLP